MSLKRLNWIEDILTRAEKSVKEDKPRMALTRIGMAKRIAKEAEGAREMEEGALLTVTEMVVVAGR